MLPKALADKVGGWTVGGLTFDLTESGQVCYNGTPVAIVDQAGDRFRVQRMIGPEAATRLPCTLEGILVAAADWTREEIARENRQATRRPTDHAMDLHGEEKEPPGGMSVEKITETLRTNLRKHYPGQCAFEAPEIPPGEERQKKGPGEAFRDTASAIARSRTAAKAARKRIEDERARVRAAKSVAPAPIPAPAVIVIPPPPVEAVHVSAGISTVSRRKGYGTEPQAPARRKPGRPPPQHPKPPRVGRFTVKPKPTPKPRREFTDEERAAIIAADGEPAAEVAQRWGVRVTTIHRIWRVAREAKPRVYKLTAERVAEIKASDASTSALASHYRVDESTIRQILRGETWGRVKPADVPPVIGEPVNRRGSGKRLPSKEHLALSADLWNGTVAEVAERHGVSPSVIRIRRKRAQSFHGEHASCS